MTIHNEPFEGAGKTYTLKDGTTYRCEDWWDRVSGGSWMDAVGNPAALQYAMHNAVVGLPLDNEVVYGKIGGGGHLRHVSELAEVQGGAAA